jgi:hypothetical protein
MSSEAKKANGHTEPSGLESPEVHESELEDPMATTRGDDLLSKALTAFLEDAGESRRQTRAMLEQNAAIMQKLASDPNGKPKKDFWERLAPWAMTIIALTAIGYTALQRSIATDYVINQLSDRVGKLETWNEKVRSNLSANGWLIDPQTGEVTRVQPKGDRRNAQSR